MKKTVRFQKELILLMKLSLLHITIAIIFAGVSLARDVTAQELLDRKINIQVANQDFIHVLTGIESQANVKFTYRPKLLTATQRITVTIVNESLGQVLDRLLQPLQLKYKVIRNQIILSPLLPKTENLGTQNELPIQNEALAELSVSGTVTDEKGGALPGVTVIVKGTSRGTTTDAQGIYRIGVPDANTVLTFSFVGYTAKDIVVGNRTEINVQLEATTNQLTEVVVTGYTTQQKKDIIGAVSVVKASDLTATPSANLVAQLQGRAAGVTVSSTGDPGSSASIRIRGFASYGNNNPLYVIDGMPTTDASRINPQDVESIQVLKDASSASIYGARAANGVIIITTKRGKTGKTTLSYDTYYGIQATPLNRIPKLLNTSELLTYLDKTTATTFADPVFGQHGSFAIPDRYVVSNAFKGGVSASDPRANPDLYTIADYTNPYQIFQTSPGTNWFDAMSQKGIIQSHQLSASGGNDRSTFSLGMNYFNQQGTFKNTGYDRYSMRLNSSFKATDFLTVGENLQVSYDNRRGDATVIGETSAWGYAIRSATFIPVYDIKGGYGGSLIGGTAGVGYNPVSYLDRRKDWFNQNLRAFGNVFAQVDFNSALAFRTSFGVDTRNGTLQRAFLKEYEASQSRRVTQLTEATNNFLSWTWSNTLTYQKKFAQIHDVKVLVGTEAIKNAGRGLFGSKSNYDFESTNFLSLNTGLPQSLGDISANDADINRNSLLSRSSMFSYFGRLDYSLKDRYLLNATFRRDGSSLFGPDVRYANFPSVGVGWRISDEAFMKSFGWLDDLKLRAGWGQMGSISNVPAFNQYSTYSAAPGNNFYDINGANIGSTQGYGANSQGNLQTQWETTESTNIGLDASILREKWSIAVDVYTKNTRDLLVPSLRNGLELLVTKPLVNLGTMRNTGIDLQLTNQGHITSELKYDATLTVTHYKNRLTKLNNENTAQLVAASRITNALITAQGQAVSSFYGYQIDGFYNSQAEVDAGPRINGASGVVGSWKYKDLNGDGNITTADRTVLGSPHPKFQMGLNLGFSWKGFDLSSFVFWNQGNQLYNYTKYFTYMGVLGGSVASGKLYDGWTPATAATAKTPQLGVGAANGYTAFVTGNSSSFYVENGSYLRGKTIQLGYSFPKTWLKTVKMSNLRVYAQAQNFFTITKYTGADPDLGLVSGASVEQTASSDQNLGVDYSGYPNPRQFLLGLNVSF
ncbi:TonB-dependent receptor [Larkinella terrae]|uniref:SusC/RagA family TonB-linked outer membrane protein n=2 Tax=Larkinella terrae TaxID=2025311 RepID=A0A7K0EMZ0_9BACT|nr:SusC/RagA family TonB-linked outer membrane protein [Larkinella terrae]